MAAFGLTGSGQSDTGVLDTVSPSLQAVAATSVNSLSVTFSEPMLPPGPTTPQSYVLSGLGLGSLHPTADAVLGSGPYTLSWNEGEMRNGESIVVEAAGFQDLAGNLIDPAQSLVSAPGLGIAPVFGNLMVEPAQATTGETVTITFSVSEPLASLPSVTINDEGALWLSGDENGEYTYRYMVSTFNVSGMASVTVRGADPADNEGSLSDTELLEILDDGTPVPLHGWLLGLVLLALGLVLLTKKRRPGAAALFMLGLLASSSAFALPPTVSNVRFLQAPDGSSGTKVDIYYDLTAPNGPCTIAVSLSKNAGSDGYPHAMNSVTGDLTGVTSGSDRHILWDIRADYPEENMAQARIRVSAEDGFQVPTVTTFAINMGEATTMAPAVTLDNAVANGPTEYIASESPSFTGATWVTHSAAPSFALSLGVGTRTVYFKVRNAGGESGVASDTIFLTTQSVSVPTGTFTMGRTLSGDDETYGSANELPAHSVTMGAYQLGKYEVTSKEFCDVLNWALAQGYLKTSTGTPWPGTGNIYAGTNVQLIVNMALSTCNIRYTGGVFVSKTRTGLPGATAYSMDTHPMTCVTWYGAVAYCNWLSRMQGLTNCYDMALADWPLTVLPPTPGGYRLPTEAEWERAAAWDPATSKHWIYGFMSDTNTGSARCNDHTGMSYVNPLGLSVPPYTSPVGWFDGTNVSPNGSVATVNSPSPVGAYDMSGNVYEWCQDWYSATYYDGGSMTNPTGPSTGTTRVLRGSGWDFDFFGSRSACRLSDAPTDLGGAGGFRIARSTPSVGVSSFSINNGNVTATSTAVTLNSICWGSATQYLASESSTFSGASWQTYESTATFAISPGVGTRTVYFKVRTASSQESAVFSDTIFLGPQTLSVPAGTFTMGRTSSGDDATYGLANELPQHQVTLSAYQLGKYEVTNQEYCDVLNWARTQGYLKTAAGATWAGSGDIYAGGNLQFIVAISGTNTNIQFSGNSFSPKTRTGLPGTTSYSMGSHPVINVSWYGAIAFCTWLSQMQGLTPCYDLSAPGWPLVVAPPTSGGYRLPTEAEWERAASWDGTKHWTYGFTSDTLTGANRANYSDLALYVNPLGLTSMPYTSPVGWFNGTNVSPNGEAATLNSASPVGAYDMSGNVEEWCQDAFSATYYSGGAMTNPTGPDTGSSRLLRGGLWSMQSRECRTAQRYALPASYFAYSAGFRIAKS